jgi:hypothetical protein
LRPSKLNLIAWIVGVLLASCAAPPKYTIQLKDGRQLESVGFPVLNDATGYYRSENAAGERSVFREDQVASILPLEPPR